MSLLSREEIFKADDGRTEDVAVPEWGGTVRLKSLTGIERDQFEASMVEMKGGKQKQNVANFRARLVGLCAIDENGAKLFTNSADVRMLGTKSSAALDRVFAKCQEMNGLSDADVGELTEGFDDGPSEDSISG